MKLASDEIEKRNFLKAESLIEPIFDGHDVNLANLLGYINSNRRNLFPNQAQAIKFYTIAAKAGDSYGQQGLAAIMKKLGKIEDALELLVKSSEGGNKDSSYHLFHHFKSKNNKPFMLKYLVRASEQGHVLAIQRVAWWKIGGKFGATKIPIGLRELIANCPKVLEYCKRQFKLHPEDFE